MTERVIGYLLLATGIIAIIIAAISVIFVFTGRTKPVQLFNFESIGLDASSLTGGAVAPNQAKMELIDANMLNETSNLFAHLFLMGFIVSVGHKVASLGTMMVRPIVVKLKQANDPPETQKKAQ